jgi:hypothetical protein
MIRIILIVFFFFFFLGPVCISSGSTSAFKAYCAIILIVIKTIIIIIIIHVNKISTRMLIAVAIPGDRNVFKKEAQKILKYKDLTMEIQHM